MLNSSPAWVFEQTIQGKLHSFNHHPARMRYCNKRIYLTWARHGEIYADGYAEYCMIEKNTKKIKYVINI